MTSHPPSTASEPAAGDGPAEFMALAAYAELTAVEHLVPWAASAPDLAARVSVLEAAAIRMDHYRTLAGTLVAAGVDPVAMMPLRRGVIDDFHARTTPRGWPESLVKVWAIGGLTTDFYGEVSQHLPEEFGAVVSGFADTMPEEFAQELVVALLYDEPTLNGRLALWARRLVGEVMTRTQRLADADTALAATVIGTAISDVSRSGAAEPNAMVARLLKRHNERMTTVGLLA